MLALNWNSPRGNCKTVFQDDNLLKVELHK